MNNIKIRPGSHDDLPSIYNLVVELAIYEKEPDAVVATLADYQNDFKDGLFETIIAEQDGIVVGMCLYYLTYSTWKGKMMYLEDFVVDQKSRGQGIGHLLFDQMIQLSKEQNCRLLKWQVLDWNEPAVNFYKKYNAIIEKEWWNCKIVF